MRRRGGSVAVLLAAVVASAALAAGCGERPRTFDEDRAFAHLVRQVEAGPRIPGSEGHRATLEYLQERLRPLADRVALHTFEAVSPLDSTGVTLHNVVAVFGEDHAVRLLLGAHWDTRPIADRDPDESRRAEPVPGANDGASGVAVLLEVAEALARKPPSVGVDLVLFDGEDLGVDNVPESFALGSQRFVADHPAYRPALVVILDMVGRTGAVFAREANSYQLVPGAVETVWAAARDAGADAFVDSTGKAMWDDHIPFLQAGIPAVDVIDTEDPAWHTTADLPGNCSPEVLGQVGRTMLALIRRFEASQQP